MAYRGSLRKLARLALTVAKQYPDAQFVIVEHPKAKYYSLVSPAEFEKLTSDNYDPSAQPIFYGSPGQLLSLIKCNLEQLDLFAATEQMNLISADAEQVVPSPEPEQYDV